MGFAHLCHLGFPNLITHHGWVVTRKPYIRNSFYTINVCWILRIAIFKCVSDICHMTHEDIDFGVGTKSSLRLGKRGIRQKCL